MRISRGTGVLADLSTAADQGLIAQNFDRQLIRTAIQMIGGTVYSALVPLRAGQVISNISIIVNAGQAGASMSLS